MCDVTLRVFRTTVLAVRAAHGLENDYSRTIVLKDEEYEQILTLGSGQHPYPPELDGQQVSSLGHDDWPSGHTLS